MSLTIEYKGDDWIHHRLLSFLNETLSNRIESLTPIRKQVFLVKTYEDDHFILKGFPSKPTLIIQEDFTRSLKNNGFPYTYSFYSQSNEYSLYFDSHYYGCIEYIHNSETPFRYNSKENCTEALSLLNKFYSTTERLVSDYQNKLPFFHLYYKWRKRYLLFLKYKKFIHNFMTEKELNELIYWAEWSLTGMEREKEFYNHLPSVILHGDVADHNFIRTPKESLYLIDFDLLSIGPALSDYIQFCNRILPPLKWSYKDLTELTELQPYFRHPFFLYALTFPTDIFREWNRLFRERSYRDDKQVQRVIRLARDNFELRRSLYHEIMSKIDS